MNAIVICSVDIESDEPRTLERQKDIDHLGILARKTQYEISTRQRQLTGKRTSYMKATFTLDGTVLENIENINN